MNAQTRLEEKLAQLGIEMPKAAAPKGLYRPILVLDGLAYTSGHLPIDASGRIVTGRVGGDLDQQAGHDAAVLAGLGILATLSAELGGLDRVQRVVKVLGVVQCTPEFDGQPSVLNGCSQLFADVFGPECGVGVRSAIGTNALPLAAAVEIEAVFQVEGAE